MSERPPIPEHVKREVRKRCGFGCVLCGAPLYQYDHMYDWSLGGAHDPENLTLLCASHHEEKTKRLIPIEKVRQANREPFNRSREVSPAHILHYFGDAFEVFLGSLTYTQKLNADGSCNLVNINDETLLKLTLEEGNLLVTLKLYDKQGSSLASIADNELTYKTSSWDVQFVGRALTVREGKGRIRARLAFDPPRRLNLQRGYFKHRGLQVEVGPDGVSAPDHNILIQGGVWTGIYSHGIVAYDEHHGGGNFDDAFLILPVDE
ncbi:HNH endonuclease [Streptomyces europaeiscabiei]|uniref:HNH endonuclease n=1 Tax=Streptomyces europaeiscabiei TaxID=146819 RepID=UPI0029A22A9E|nr:HNH endonuclease signature motif containing protein [Streptomyces europaeiscabiei]MDX3838961.1 HNH endonuclease signature motif containing protein [Streptomyces europaeiscabiei]